MKVAAIDIGTNTFHLLVAEKSGSAIKFIVRKTCVVKLGKEGFNNGLISEMAFKRGLNAMRLFSALLKKNKPHQTIALATSAIRSCRNGDKFIRHSEKIIGSKIEIISGEREAELIYHGVKNSFPMNDKPVLIMDIGGGSVEFVIATKSKILGKKSIEAGAARLVEKFSPSNPIKNSELSAMKNYFEKVFSPVFESIKQFKPEILIGSSGSFDSFALMTGSKSKKLSVEISLKKYFALHNKLICSTKKERLSMKGLHRMRVDMIVPASVCLNFILKKTGIKNIFRSAYALREGIIFTDYQ